MAVLAPQYSDPCGQLMAGNVVTRPGQLNLGVRWFSTDLVSGDLAGRTKNKRLVIFLY